MRTRLLKWSVMFVLLLPLVAHGTNDSLLAIMNAQNDTTAVIAGRRLGQKYIKIDLDTAIMYLTQSLNLADQLDYVSGVFSAYESLGIANASNGAYAESLSYYGKAMEVIEKENLPVVRKVGILNNMGVAHYISGNVGAAIEPYLSLIHI